MAAWERTGDGLEFDRVVFFSDAVFAIAMTLLVIEVGVPHVSDDRLGAELVDRVPAILSFFISFVVVGHYWLAHHRFFAQLKAVPTTLMTLNLVYLAAIAFVPFPTALVGEYEGAPVSVVMYAVTLGVASSLEAVMFAYARARGAFRVEIPDDVYRFGLRASLAPVVLFAVSIPIALGNTTAALVSWLLLFPIGMLLDRTKPAQTDELFR